MLNVQEIIADGVVDAAEVASIRADIFADGVIDRDEADQLFEINDGVSGNANDPSWTDLFAKAISEHVLADETSPGVVDKEEADYLIEKMGADGKVDDVEKATLKKVLTDAKEVHQSLVDYAAAAGVTV